jgi:hypothetical protein
MDKMVSLDDYLPARLSNACLQIQTSKGEVIVTNDGATILKSIQALHPASKMVWTLITYPKPF